MRVQTGSAKGRKLKMPAGMRIRPTTGRVKKSIFDTLGDIRGFVVLDLFAGSGSLGIEALSRQAQSAVFVEKEREAVKSISENIHKCGFEDRSEIMSTDYRKAINLMVKQSRKFNLVFIDPPYDLYEDVSPVKFVDSIRELLSLPWEIVIEHGKDHDFEHSDSYLETRNFGSTQISYFREEAI